MKRFKQHIKEAFNKPYSWKKDRWAGVHTRYIFKTDDGRTGSVTMESPDDEVADVDFEINSSTVITGGGDQFRIFATVGAALDDYIKSTPTLWAINFESFKDDTQVRDGGRDTRKSLYSLMAKKLAKKYKMRLTTSGYGSHMKFTLINDKKEPGK